MTMTAGTHDRSPRSNARHRADRRSPVDSNAMLAARFGPSAPVVDTHDLPEAIKTMLTRSSCRSFTGDDGPRDVVAFVEEYGSDRVAPDRRAEHEQRDVHRFGITERYGWAEDRTRHYATPDEQTGAGS